MRSAASPDPTPSKPPNKLGSLGAEAAEGRGLAKGNTASKTRSGHCAGEGVSARWVVCVEQQGRTRRCGSPRSCTM